MKSKLIKQEGAVLHSKVLECVQALKGRTVVEACIGHGSFVTFDFAFFPDESTESEWHLWVMCVDWRLEKGSNFLLGNEFKDKESSRALMRQLNNLKVLSIRCETICNDLTIYFEDDYIFRTFSYYEAEPDHYESWMLFTNDKYVAVVGPGTRIQYHRSDEPSDE